MNANEWLQERARIRQATVGEGWARFLTSASTSGQGVADSEDEQLFWPTQGGITVAEPENAEFIVDAHNSLPHLVAAAQAVLDLHKPKDYSFVDVDDDGNQFEGDALACVTCGTHSEYPIDFPCPTVAAIRTALNAAGGAH